MIIYSTIPQELIFADYINYKQSNEQMIIYEGIPIIAEQVDGKSYRVSQILSTDPKHFLHEKCYPGATIDLF